MRKQFMVKGTKLMMVQDGTKNNKLPHTQKLFMEKGTKPMTVQDGMNNRTKKVNDSYNNNILLKCI